MNSFYLEASANFRDVPGVLPLSGDMEFLKAQDGDGDSSAATFKMIANTGVLMRARGFFDPVVVDMKGVKVGAKKTPILLEHSTWLRAGFAEEVNVEASRITASGVLMASNESAQEVIDDAVKGFPFQASIGGPVEKAEFVEAGQSVTVNGKTFKGPLVVARKMTIREISICVLGADGKTSVSIAATEDLPTLRVYSMKFEQWLSATYGLSLEALSEEQQAKFQAAFDKENATDPKSPPPLPGGNDKLEASDGDELQKSRELRAQDSLRIAGIEAYAKLTANADKFTAKVNGNELSLPQLQAHAIEKGWSVDKFELTVHRSTQHEPTAPAIHSRTMDMEAGALCAAMVRDFGTPSSKTNKSSGKKYGIEAMFDDKTLEASDDAKYRNVTLHQLLDMNIALSGGYFSGNRKSVEFLKAASQAEQTLKASGFSTLSVSNVLENVANKLLLASYEAQEVVWPLFCGIKNNTDFKVHSIYRLEGAGRYRKVGATGEIKHGSLSDQKYTLQLDTYAEIMGLNRQQMINDDLDAFNQIPNILGRDAALSIESAFFVMLLSNPGSFFSTGNGNLLSGGTSDLGIGGLTLAEAAFGNQVDSAGKPVLVSPDRILTGTQDHVTAKSLHDETKVVGDTDRTANNPHAGKYMPYKSTFINNTAALNAETGEAITGQNANQWYLAADPNRLAAFLVGFLNGRRVPILESSETEFSTLGMQWRSYHDWGLGTGDPKGMVKMAGT